MGAIASQITSLTIVYSTVYSDADQRKHQSSVSLAFVRGIHRGPVNSPHKWPVTRKMFPFDDVIMISTSFIVQIQFCVKWLQFFVSKPPIYKSLLWGHNERDDVLNHWVSIVCSTVCSGANQRKHQSSVSLTFVRGDTPVTDGFPSQRASNTWNISIWWRHQVSWDNQLANQRLDVVRRYGEVTARLL